jgi:membrane protein required for colicin V production
MTTLDIILLILLGLAVIDGIRKGIVVQLGGIVGIVIGIWLAFRYCEPVGVWLRIDPDFARYVAFALIVLASILVLGVIGWCLGKVINLVGLGLLNRLGGAVLALAKGVLILGALLIVFQAVNEHTGIVGRRQFDDSRLCGPIVRTTYAILPFLKQAVEHIDFRDENQ